MSYLSSFFVRDTGNGKSVEQGLAEASPVELPTRLVETVLGIFRGDVVKEVKQGASGIACRDVHLRKHLPDLTFWHCSRMVLLHNVLETSA